MAESSARVAHGVQVALEGGLAAEAHRLAVGDHRALVASPARLVQPCAIALAEVLDQPGLLARGEVADGVQAMGLELLVGARADAVDLAAGQGPDAGGEVVDGDNADAVGLVELAGKLGEQLVGRDANGAGELRHFEDALLDAARQLAATVAFAAGDVGEVDVDLVDAAVLHHRRDLRDSAFEEPGDTAYFVEIHRQQDGVRAELGGLHQAHGGADSELAGGVGGGGDDAAAGVGVEAGERFPAGSGAAFPHSIPGRDAFRAGARTVHPPGGGRRRSPPAVP